jgi:hypothetical protein
MQLTQFIDRVSTLCGFDDSIEVLRLAYLMANRVDSLDQLDDDNQLQECYRRVVMQLQVATDQHLAVSKQLDRLADSEPTEFTPDHVWALVRAIKTQSAILQMFQGQCTTTP